MISGIRRLLPSLHMARPVRTELRARPELPRSGGGLQGCYYHKFHFYGTDSQIPMNLEKVHAECSCDAEEDVNTAAEQTRRCRGEGSWAPKVFPAPLPTTHPEGSLLHGALSSPAKQGRDSPGLQRVWGGEDRLQGTQ